MMDSSTVDDGLQFEHLLNFSTFGCESPVFINKDIKSEYTKHAMDIDVSKTVKQTPEIRVQYKTSKSSSKRQPHSESPIGRERYNFKRRKLLKDEDLIEELERGVIVDKCDDIVAVLEKKYPFYYDFGIKNNFYRTTCLSGTNVNEPLGSLAGLYKDMENKIIDLLRTWQHEELLSLLYFVVEGDKSCYLIPVVIEALQAIYLGKSQMSEWRRISSACLAKKNVLKEGIILDSALISCLTGSTITATDKLQVKCKGTVGADRNEDILTVRALLPALQGLLLYYQHKQQANNEDFSELHGTEVDERKVKKLLEKTIIQAASMYNIPIDTLASTYIKLSDQIGEDIFELLPKEQLVNHNLCSNETPLLKELCQDIHSSEYAIRLWNTMSDTDPKVLSLILDTLEYEENWNAKRLWKCVVKFLKMASESDYDVTKKVRKTLKSRVWWGDYIYSNLEVCSHLVLYQCIVCVVICGENHSFIKKASPVLSTAKLNKGLRKISFRVVK